MNFDIPPEKNFIYQYVKAAAVKSYQRSSEGSEKESASAGKY